MSEQLVRVGIETNKDHYLRIVAPRNLFIEFIHEVRSATRLPSPHWESGEKFINDLKGAWLNGRVQTAEELIVVFNHNVINLYFTANESTMYAYELLW